MHHNQSFSREFHSQYTFLLHRTVAEPEAAVFVFFLCEAHSSFKGKGKNLKNAAEVIWASSVEGMVLLWPRRSYSPCYFSRLFEVEPTDNGGRLFASWPTLTESLPWAGHYIKRMVFTKPAITALYNLQWLLVLLMMSTLALWSVRVAAWSPRRGPPPAQVATGPEQLVLFRSQGSGSKDRPLEAGCSVRKARCWGALASGGLTGPQPCNVRVLRDASMLKLLF